MRLRPVLSAFAASTFALAILPAVAVGLTLEPDDPVADHLSHDSRLAEGAAASSVEPPDDVPAVAEPAQHTFHTLRAGESLASVAAAYGLDGLDDWRLLFDANPDIEHPDIVEPGAVLRIPERGEQLRRRELPAPVVPVRSGKSAAGGDVWWRLALCESGGQNRVSSGGRYFGFFQFAPDTWRSVAGSGLPTDHGYGEQLHRAQMLQSRAGWGQWPACARSLGLR